MIRSDYKRSWLKAVSWRAVATTTNRPLKPPNDDDENTPLPPTPTQKTNTRDPTTIPNTETENTIIMQEFYL